MLHLRYAMVHTAPITLAPPGQCPPPDLLAEFKRGVIWDPAIFEMIKDIKQWNSWKRTFMAMAKAQEVKKAINSKYIPPPTENALFCEQKKYMYSLLLSVVKATNLRPL